MVICVCELLASMLLLLSQPSLHPDVIFRQYAVKSGTVSQRVEISPAKKDIVIGRRWMYSADETREQFITRIRNAVKGRRTFAGHYAVVGYSCGAGCRDSAIVDIRTNRVTFLPFTVTMCPGQEAAQLDFRVDSRLLIVEGQLEWDPDPKGEMIVENCGTYYFEWTEGRLKRVAPKPVRP